MFESSFDDHRNCIIYEHNVSVNGDLTFNLRKYSQPLQTYESLASTSSVFVLQIESVNAAPLDELQRN